jgi:thiol:disulfide interchange protein DsbD
MAIPSIMNIKSRWFIIEQTLAIFMGLLLLSTHAQAALFTTVKHPLPADLAFAVTTQKNNDQIDVIWSIADDYYLYQDKLAFTTSNNQPLEQVLLPLAVVKQDPLFGTTKVYYRQLHVTGVLPDSQTTPTHLTISYQGCWSGGVCYPNRTYSHQQQYQREYHNGYEK